MRLSKLSPGLFVDRRIHRVKALSCAMTVTAGLWHSGLLSAYAIQRAARGNLTHADIISHLLLLPCTQFCKYTQFRLYDRSACRSRLADLSCKQMQHGALNVCRRNRCRFHQNGLSVIRPDAEDLQIRFEKEHILFGIRILQHPVADLHLPE